MDVYELDGFFLVPVICDPEIGPIEWNRWPGALSIPHSRRSRESPIRDVMCLIALLQCVTYR